MATCVEWTPGEWLMLERIDWEHEQFRFPGIEAFDVAVSEPGAVALTESDPRG